MGVEQISLKNSSNLKQQQQSNTSPLMQGTGATLLAGLSSGTLLVCDKYFPDETRNVVKFLNFDFSETSKSEIGKGIFTKYPLKTQIKWAAILSITIGAIYGLSKYFTKPEEVKHNS